MRKLGVVLLALSVVAVAVASSTAQFADITGKWVGTWVVPNGTVSGGTEFNFQQKDDAVSGMVVVRNRPMTPVEYEVPVTGKMTGRKISLQWNAPNQLRTYMDADVAGDGNSMEGTATSGAITSIFKVRRQK